MALIPKSSIVKEIDFALRATDDAVESVRLRALRSGRIARGVVVTTSPTPVRHGLGHAPEGIIIVRWVVSGASALGTWWESKPEDQIDPKNFVYLQGETTGTLDILFF